MQQKQVVNFATTQKKGKITRIGKGSILQPKVNFSGHSIKWYEDKPKARNK